jgi:hypothetical protein
MRYINTKKHLNGLSDVEAFSSYEGRNFYRSYCRSVGNEAYRKIFQYNAHPDAGGKYEEFVLIAVIRAIESVIAHQMIGMNALYPPGNFSLLNEKFRKSKLSAAADPTRWGYAKIPFDRMYSRHYDGNSYYVREFTQWGKKMTYEDYQYAPHRYMERLHESVSKNQMDMDKSFRSNKKYGRKPYIERMPFEEVRFLLALIPAVAHENLTFLNEIRNGEHTYRGYIPKISESDLAVLRGE